MVCRVSTLMLRLVLCSLSCFGFHQTLAVGARGSIRPAGLLRCTSSKQFSTRQQRSHLNAMTKDPTSTSTTAAAAPRHRDDKPWEAEDGAGILVNYDSSSSDDGGDEDDEDDEEIEPGVIHPDEENLRPNKRSRSSSFHATHNSSSKNEPSNNNNNNHFLSGIYIPPFKRRLTTKNTEEEPRPPPTTTTTIVESDQRQSWEDLKRNIHGTINRLNTSTIQPCILQLIQSANLIRGKGILTKAILRAAITSPPYSPVYASFIAVLSSKLPELGELLLARTLEAFQRHYTRKEKKQTLAVVGFVGHLYNQGLCHELLCLQLETLLLEEPISEDGMEVAIHLFYIIGQALLQASPAGVSAIMERFRILLQEGKIHTRIQYKVEELLKQRKKQFIDYPSLIPELDLVEKEDQIMFDLTLEHELDRQEELDLFRYDAEFEMNEQDWKNIQREILGDEEVEEEEDPVEEQEQEDKHQLYEEDRVANVDMEDESMQQAQEADEEDNEDAVLVETPVVPFRRNDSQLTVIHDLSEQDLIHLRRTIYLTIMSSASFEECTHKLTKIDIPVGKEMELINMIIECCSQERTFLRYYGLISGRFCLLHDRWRRAFEQSFVDQYNTIHRLETNKLRNVAKLFAHLLHTDSLPWSVLHVIHLNEDETTSSSRIFIKVLIQSLAETLGMATLLQRLETDDPETNEWFKGMFPKDNPRNTRYAINFFTSIGLGPLTDGLREYLKNAPKLIMLQAQAEAERKALENTRSSSDSSDEDDSSSSVTSSSSSSSYTSTSSSSYTSRSSRSSSSSSSSTSSGSRSSYSSSSSSSIYSSSSGSTTSSSSSSYSSDESRRNKRRKSRYSSSSRKNKKHSRRRSSSSSSESRDDRKREKKYSSKHSKTRSDERRSK